MPTKFGNGADLAGQKIIHLADGSAADDAATWGQVQQFLAGLSWKDEVAAASTANVNIASTPSSIDGVTLSTGARVLLKDQTDATQNGIYVCGATGAAMSRATDADAPAELNNATVLVTGGTANADRAFTQTAISPTVGSSAITFVPFGAGMTYTNGNGIALAGGVFSVKLPGSGVVGLVVDGTGVYIDTSVVVRKYAANIGDGSATSIPIVHNFGTRDVTVSIQDATSHAMVITDWVATDANTVTLTFAGPAPTSGQYRVTVHG